MFLSGFIPLFNAELFMVWAGTQAHDAELLLVVVVAALGQMLAKLLIYGAGRGVVALPLGRYEEKVAGWQQRVHDHALGLSPLMFISASVGWPPFYVMSFLGGALTYSVLWFSVLGFAGRALRFGLLAFATEAVAGWLL